MIGCARTAEVQALLRLGHWPQAAGEELASHVRGCRRCGEVVLVTQAMTTAKARAMVEAPLEPPGLVWWRAQLRRRREVVQRVERPLVAQMVAVAVVMCVGLVLAFRLSGGVASWRAWVSAGAGAVVRSSMASFGLAMVVASVAALAMMAGLAVYLTVDRR